MPDLRESIQAALQDFRTKPLRQASLALLDTLGYPHEYRAALNTFNPSAFSSKYHGTPA